MENRTIMNIEEATDLVIEELARATYNFGEFKSTHEGYAIILEELDELWDEIKNNSHKELLETEAKQVAAMALRFLIDCC